MKNCMENDHAKYQFSTAHTMCKCGFCIKPDFAGRLKKSPKCGTNLEIQKERIWTDMNKLKCSVTTCRHNTNDLCELRKIQVDGPAALESRETCCGSYAERTSSSENSCGCSSSPSATADVHCSAEHCTYNDNHKCSADCVCVGCCCADPEVVSETECCTFERRA